MLFLTTSLSLLSMAASAHAALTLGDLDKVARYASFCAVTRSGLTEYYPAAHTPDQCAACATCAAGFALASADGDATAVAAACTCDWVLKAGYETDEALSDKLAAHEARLADPEACAQWLIKLDESVFPTQEHLDRIDAASGHRVGHFMRSLDDHAGFVTLYGPLKAAQAVRALDEVDAVIPLTAELKLDPDLYLELAGRRPHDERTELMIELSPHAKQDAQEAAHLAAVWREAVAHLEGVVIEDHSHRYFTVKNISAPQMAELVAFLGEKPECASIAEREKVFAYNKHAPFVTQAKAADKSTPIWDAGLTGKGIVVGVGDSGLDTNSCYFFDQAVGPLPPLNKGDVGNFPNHRKVAQYVAYADGGEGEETGHGTHVSGSVAGNCVGGNAAYTGMAPDAKLAFFDIGYPNTGGLDVPGDLSNNFFNLAYSVGARLHTNSWGSAGNGAYTNLAAQVDRFMFDNQDFLVLVANGNDGRGGITTAGAPATSKSCLAVGASVNMADAFLGTPCQNLQAITGPCHENVADFSSRGPTTDGRISPSVVAPGKLIYSANSNANPQPNHGGSVGLQGTSMATPVTAGNAALMMQYFTEGFYPLGIKSASNARKPMGALLKAAFVNSGRKMDGTQSAATAALNYYDTSMGFGLTALDQTLKIAGGPEFDLFADGFMETIDQVTLAQGQSKTYTFQIDKAGPFKATLAWSDAPANNAARTLVNNLNMEVTVNGQAQAINGRNGADNINTVEQAIVANAQPGQTIVVTVTGAQIVRGPQPFAVVVTGNFVNAADLFGDTAANVLAYDADVKPSSPFVIKGNGFFPDAAMNEVTFKCEGADYPGTVTAASSYDLVVESGITACTSGALEAVIQSGGFGTGEPQVVGQLSSSGVDTTACESIQGDTTCEELGCSFNAETGVCGGGLNIILIVIIVAVVLVVLLIGAFVYTKSQGGGGGGGGFAMSSTTTTTTASAALPPGWQAMRDPNTQQTYYYNAALDKTQWDVPTAGATGMSPPPAGGALPPGWRIETDPSTGDRYYYNANTGQSTWDRPRF